MAGHTTEKLDLGLRNYLNNARALGQSITVEKICFYMGLTTVRERGYISRQLIRYARNGVLRNETPERRTHLAYKVLRRLPDLPPKAGVKLKRGQLVRGGWVDPAPLGTREQQLADRIADDTRHSAIMQAGRAALTAPPVRPGSLDALVGSLARTSDIEAVRGHLDGIDGSIKLRHERLRELCASTVERISKIESQLDVIGGMVRYLYDELKGTTP